MEQQEFDMIVDKVIEAVLLKMPEVLGNIIKDHAIINRLNKDFYNTHPDFKGNLPLVKGIIEQLESENVGKSYEEILKIAAPIIQDRIKLIEACEVSNKPDIKSLDLSANNLDSNGSL